MGGEKDENQLICNFLDDMDLDLVSDDFIKTCLNKCLLGDLVCSHCFCIMIPKFVYYSDPPSYYFIWEAEYNNSKETIKGYMCTANEYGSLFPVSRELPHFYMYKDFSLQNESHYLTKILERKKIKELKNFKGLNNSKLNMNINKYVQTL